MFWIYNGSKANFRISKVNKLWYKEVKNLDSRERNFDFVDKTSLLEFVYEIKKRRLKLGITQKDLARMMGTTQSIISKLEKGNYNPTYFFLKRLAEVLEGDIKLQFESKNTDIDESSTHERSNFKTIFYMKIDN